MEPITAAVVGLVVGLVAGWFVRGMSGNNARRAIEDAKERLGETVKAEVAGAIRENSEVLVGMADENFQKTMAVAKGELDRKHQLFEVLVKPLSEGYEKLNPQIEQLSAHMQSVTAETAKLSGALLDNRQVGNWGEIQLRRVVELAGMAKHCDFDEQPTGEKTPGRPDMVVWLPNNRAVVVDAKASIAAFLEARAPDGDAAKAALDRHAKALRKQVDDLAKKNYPASFANAVDFTVMFVPGDQFLSAALKAAPELVEHGMRKRVAIATPASLIALLWAVAQGWQQVDVARNAKELQAVGRDLHESVLRFIDKYQRIGKALDAAVKAHNQSIGAFDEGVAPKARRFAEMAVGGTDESRFQVAPVEGQVRVPKSVAAGAGASQEGSGGGAGG